jgi:predicted HicB family RNase H-like nuclease
MAPRIPLKFDIDSSPATEVEIAKVSATVTARGAPTIEADRKQVGARIPAALYRQLKSRAALQGETVQNLVEQAIAHFLENDQQSNKTAM